MSDILPFGLDDFPQLDVKEGTSVVIHLEGKVVSRDANRVEVEVSTKDIQTEKAVDKEYKQMTEQPALESGNATDGKDDVDW